MVNEFCTYHYIIHYNSVAVHTMDDIGEILMYGDREMHQVTCADCGKETEVPFKPDGRRPVYCRDCYQNHRPPRRY